MGMSSRKAYTTFDELCEVEKRNNECPQMDDSSAVRENKEHERENKEHERENKEHEREKSSDEAQVSSWSGR